MLFKRESLVTVSVLFWMVQKKIFSAFSSQSWDENNFRHAQQSQNSCAVNSYFHYASLQEFHGKFSVFWPAPSLEFQDPHRSERQIMLDRLDEERNMRSQKCCQLP